MPSSSSLSSDEDEKAVPRPATQDRRRLADWQIVVPSSFSGLRRLGGIFRAAARQDARCSDASGGCASRLVVVVVQPFAPLSIEFRLGAGPFALGALLLLLAALVLSFAAAGGLAHDDDEDERSNQSNKTTARTQFHPDRIVVPYFLGPSPRCSTGARAANMGGFAIWKRCRRSI